MKRYILIPFLVGSVTATPWIYPENEESYAQRVLPYIEDAQLKSQAAAAIHALAEAQNVSNVTVAVTQLGCVNAVPAKIAALYYAVDPASRKSLETSIRLRLADLPLVLSWLITNGMTAQNLFSVTDASVKGDQLNVLVAKVNEILSSSGLPVTQNPGGATGWHTYTPENLKLWAAGQIEWSISKVKWSSQEAIFLRDLLGAVNVARIPPEAGRGALIDFTIPPATATEQRPRQKVMPSSDTVPTQTTAMPEAKTVWGWSTWLLLALAAVSGAWLLLRKSQR